MANFKEIVNANPGEKLILQGNQAFALGVMHAGFHAADGYPGTPSTEVIDKSLGKVQDQIKVGWSVNEAVAVAVGVGHAIAGDDTLVTMKTPGAFQAGDTITTAAFYNAPAGALVLYIASDYVPSSTQHVIDLKYFLSAARIPVLEPRTHQDMYEIARQAADISRKFNTPVAILANGILCHSEGLITTKEKRVVIKRELPHNLKNWMGMPGIARKNYDIATTQRIPAIAEWIETSDLVSEIKGDGKTAWSVIAPGESYMVVKDVLESLGLYPNILSFAMTYPLPENTILDFAKKQKGDILIFEDGDRYIEDKLKLLGLKVFGKEKYSTITEWTPKEIMENISNYTKTDIEKVQSEALDLKPVSRPPSICPGCPYRAFSVSVKKLRKEGTIFSSFGDIGCSTLIYFYNAIDTCLCMGASDSVRQGFVLSRPEYASKTISVIGDSCECHSGLDATRNAVFRNTPGVKIVLDNRITAMTGGQQAPSSATNLAGVDNKFDLIKAEEAESARVVAVNSYDMKGIEKELKNSLKLAENGEFTTMVLQGPCIHEVAPKKKKRTIRFNYDKCKRCGKCNICTGIEFDETRTPHFTALCADCGGENQVCKQICPFGAIEFIEEDAKSIKAESQKIIDYTNTKFDLEIDEKELPKSLRLAIRGIGGQGNLFFGKVLGEVIINTPYKNTNIIKGDTHGMAQLGGSVISTFSCGDIYSPKLSPKSCDVLVVMEESEVLQPEFLELLKPGGKIIFNKFTALPASTSLADYPQEEKILELLKGFDVKVIDAYESAKEIGDIAGKSANTIALGLLSTIKPFNAIPEGIWVNALKTLSPNEKIANLNINAFMKGRTL